MGDGTVYESVPISGIPEVTREHWQSEPVPSVLLDRPIRATLVSPSPREAHLVQQAYLSDIVRAELTDIPVEDDKHEVPVASLIDDVKRKKDLRKVMGKGNKFGLEGEDADSKVIDAGTPTLPKELVNYRYSGQKGQMCQDCRMFSEPAACTLVIGMIRPVDTCDRFEAKSESALFTPDGPIVAELVRTSESQREREFFTKIQAKMEDEGYSAGYSEVSPPGWEGTVLRMKKHPEITNPWALAWYMRGKGYSSHAGPRGGKKKESFREHKKDDSGKWVPTPGEGGTSFEDEPTVVNTMKGGYQKDVRMGDRTVANLTKVIRGNGYRLRFDDAIAEQYGLKDPDRKFPDSHSAAQYVKNILQKQPKKDSETEAGTSAGVKKGWATRKGGGRSKFAPDTHDDEDSTTATFTRREKPRQRLARIKRKPVDPETADAIRRALMSEAVHGRFMGFVRESTRPVRRATLIESGYEDEAGTSDGAKKGWEKRKGGGGGKTGQKKDALQRVVDREWKKRRAKGLGPRKRMNPDLGGALGAAKTRAQSRDERIRQRRRAEKQPGFAKPRGQQKGPGFGIVRGKGGRHISALPKKGRSERVNKILQRRRRSDSGDEIARARNERNRRKRWEGPYAAAKKAQQRSYRQDDTARNRARKVAYRKAFGPSVGSKAHRRQMGRTSEASRLPIVRAVLVG